MLNPILINTVYFDGNRYLMEEMNLEDSRKKMPGTLCVGSNFQRGVTHG